MGRAETVTLLPIDRYAYVMGLGICAFNGVNGGKAPLGTGCDSCWSQWDREDLALTIAQAEEMIAIELGFWPAPKFITSEDVWLGRVRSDWWNAELRTQWGYVDAFGTEQLTLVDENSPVTYEDRKPDPYDREETAIIGEPADLYYFPSGSCSDPCDVAVFFREEDGAWDDADPRWEIRPLTSDVDGDNLIITGESCMFVRPALWDDTTEECINFDTDNLVDYVDVYCRTVNTTLPVTIKWDGYCRCASNVCEHATQTACAHITDNKMGFFTARPATGSNVWACPTYCDFPEKVTINYRAGYPLDSRTCRMNPSLERAVVKLTNALLPEPPCGYCDAAETRWNNDRKNVEPLTVEAANLPWDLYTQGALEAWRIVKMFALGRGGKMGR